MTKEELKAIKEEVETVSKKLHELTEEELEQVTGGSDVDDLRTSGKDVPLPQARYKKKIDGGYDGNVFPAPTILGANEE